MLTIEDLQINLHMLIEQRSQVKDIKHIVQLELWILQVERYISMSHKATEMLQDIKCGAV